MRAALGANRKRLAQPLVVEALLIGARVLVVVAGDRNMVLLLSKWRW